MEYRSINFGKARAHGYKIALLYGDKNCLSPLSKIIIIVGMLNKKSRRKPASYNDNSFKVQ